MLGEYLAGHAVLGDRSMGARGYSREMTIAQTIQNYFEVTKPRIVALLVFTAVGGMIVAGGKNISTWAFSLIATAVALGAAGANAITGYLDRDIDAVMSRTKDRPLPTRRISPAKKALYYGLSLCALSLILSAAVNLLSSLLGLLGMLDNILVYSKWLKRRNPVSIILGGLSGGLPVLIGYVAIKNTITLPAVLMAALVVLWIPTHIWSLAIRYREDYEKAKVPMLPVVVEEKKALRCIASTSILLVMFSVLLFFINIFGLVYLVTASLLGSVMVAMTLWLFFHPTKQNAWVVFKFSSPYLTMIFLAMIIDVLLIP